MPAAKPPEFRRRAVELARRREQPIAKDLGSPSPACARADASHFVGGGRNVRVVAGSCVS
jgi:hypothetical protein